MSEMTDEAKAFMKAQVKAKTSRTCDYTHWETSGDRRIPIEKMSVSHIEHTIEYLENKLAKFGNPEKWLQVFKEELERRG